MSTYLLNSAVLTEFGKFDYTAVTVDKAREILAPGFTSAIGHEVTAAFCSIAETPRVLQPDRGLHEGRRHRCCNSTQTEAA